MTTVSAIREGRQLARSLTGKPAEWQDRVLAAVPPQVRDAARRHLAYLERKAS